jgi:hypothetical protein
MSDPRSIGIILVSLSLLVPAMAAAAPPREGRTIPVWGRVLEAEGADARVGLDPSQGVWVGDAVSLHRKDAQGRWARIGSLTIRGVGEREVSARGEGVLRPAPGDMALFRKPAPAADPEDPINALIGAPCTIAFAGRGQERAAHSARLLSLDLGPGGDICAVKVGFTKWGGGRSPAATYPAAQVRSLAVGGGTYVPDPATRLLATSEAVRGRVAAREAGRKGREAGQKIAVGQPGGPAPRIPAAPAVPTPAVPTRAGADVGARAAQQARGIFRSLEDVLSQAQPGHAPAAPAAPDISALLEALQPPGSVPGMEGALGGIGAPGQ